MIYDSAVKYRAIEYDSYYDVRTNADFEDSRVGLVTGVLLIVIGAFQIIFSLIDMDWGVYNLTKTAVGQNNLIWATNGSIWPTYGKGSE